MSMTESIYMIGQISPDDEETYQWRERVRDFFKDDSRIRLIDPCNNGFNQKVLKDNKEDPQRLRIYKTKGTNLLVPKDYSYVRRSTMGLANLNHYDPRKPIIGTCFELAWYYANPEKTVIGIFDGNPKKDIHCNHPFVRETVDIWVKNDFEACRLIEHFYLDPDGTGEVDIDTLMQAVADKYQT